MNKSTVFVGAAALAIGLSGGFFIANMGDSQPTASESSTSSEREILYYKAPMDPSFRSDKPGKSPMGMDLVPVYADENEDGADDRNLVKINPVVQNNIGVRYGKVEKTTLARNINTVGFIQADDDETASVDVRTEGWIEKLYIKSVGEHVKKGQPLFDLYSKPLVTAQDEYLQALRIGRASLIRAAKGRLTALGLSNKQIEFIKRTGKSRRLNRVFAPRDGVVTMVSIGEGAYVKPGSKIMMLADLSSVWVLAEVFETQASWVKPGQAVTMQVDAEPGRVWSGVVDYIYPTINSGSRTVQVRLAFSNPDGILRPQGYAKLIIETDPKVGVLAVDREALIRAGKSDRVIVALGDGRFQPAEVKTGMESGGKVEILSGLEENEKIVVSSQFLIDSEASLRGTTLRMSEQEPMAMDAVEEASSKGVVVSVMAGHGMITLEHDAIADFDWPAMEMDFVTDPEFLDDIEPGDTVHFTVLRTANDDGEHVISSLMKMTKNEENAK